MQRRTRRLDLNTSRFVGLTTYTEAKGARNSARTRNPVEDVGGAN